MNLSVLSVFIFFILLTHNIILVNEESLILICFVITLSVFISKFNYLTNSAFEEYKISRKEKLTNNLVILNQTLNKVISQNRNQLFLTSLIQIKNYWGNFGRNFVYWLGLDMVYKTRSHFKLCFNSIQNNENKITKLLNSALNQELSKKVLLNNFIEKKLLNSKLKARNLIVVREWAQIKLPQLRFKLCQ